MPNIKSAIKRVKVAEKKRVRNRAVKSSVRTFVKNAEKSITLPSSGVEATQESVARALKALDSAASKGILHKNNAARRKSRLMKKLNVSAAKV
ncbi:MAG TPA: 30S ribosomal protein S20 [Chloroflexota bacterium]